MLHGDAILTRYNPDTEVLQPEIGKVILGPNDNQDGCFLIQREDGTFWTYYGCPIFGWFGGNPNTLVESMVKE